ncbi:MAG: hypothetical protein NC122_02585 [Faecalibacterium sp.]|nr:hypothetical protein [Ruminococcus sp.]MCM1391970.1 hypothetical protein [Ruminococcus sp.]MCM1485071.1 hypothetical protein [Faecalibacterium sp.]
MADKRNSTQREFMKITRLVEKTENDGSAVNLVIKLAVEGDNPNYKNSIITAIKESDKRFEQRLRNDQPVYIRLTK